MLIGAPGAVARLVMLIAGLVAVLVVAVYAVAKIRERRMANSQRVIESSVEQGPPS